MPIVRCTKDGKSGWKVKNTNNCWTGPGAKRRAYLQWYAIDKEEMKKELKKGDINKEIASELIEDPETPDDLIDFIMDIAKFDTVERMFANLRRQDLKLERINNNQEDV